MTDDRVEVGESPALAPLRGYAGVLFKKVSERRKNTEETSTVNNEPNHKLKKSSADYP
jgi:hypothetical protein